MNVKVVSLIAGLTMITGSVILGDMTGIYSLVDSIKNKSKPSAQSAVASTNTTTPTSSVEPLAYGKPARLIIPELSIDLAVEPGYYDPDSMAWTLSKTNLNWGVMTEQLNNKQGLTYIYGHYKKGVLLNLPKIKPDQEVQVISEDGITFVYKFRSSQIVEPHNAKTLEYTGAPPVLIIQTCTGLRFEKRQMFTFDYLRNY